MFYMYISNRGVFWISLACLISFPLDVLCATSGSEESLQLPTIDAPSSLSPAERALAQRERAQLEKTLAECKSQAVAADKQSKQVAADFKELQEKAARLEQERDESNRLVREEKKGKEGLAAKLKSTQAELAQSELKSKAKNTPSPQVTAPAGITPSASSVTSTPASGLSFTDPTTGMEFVSVPGGCFEMGDQFGDGESDEQPVHTVCVDSFSMGKYEVTQGEWVKMMESYPSIFQHDIFQRGDRYPVEKVSWNDAQEFTKKLNSKTDKKYRLPTEAEWEYAAREGGKKVRFGTGKDTIGPDEANFDGIAQHKKPYSRSGEYRQKTVPVGSFKPNSLGLYDMSGNVWEWCSDWYDSAYYKDSPRQNPQGPSSLSYRVVRGGSWNYDPGYVRAANRYINSPDYAGDNLGFRLVLPSSASGK